MKTELRIGAGWQVAVADDGQEVMARRDVGVLGDHAVEILLHGQSCHPAVTVARQAGATAESMSAVIRGAALGAVWWDLDVILRGDEKGDLIVVRVQTSDLWTVRRAAETVADVRPAF